MIEVPKGLDDVIVGESAVSLVDGKNGELSYRGISVDELVTWPFTRVAGWVVTGKDAVDLEVQLADAATLSERESAMVVALPETLHPMHVLQACAPALDPTHAFGDFGAAAQGLAIAAKLPAIVATHLSRSRLAASTEPNYIDRFLTQIDAPQTAIVRRAFETMQILQIEHGFNASTFAGRVVASTLAPVENALAGAIGTLHGVLHGGADQAALETADRFDDVASARDFVDACIEARDKVMGMGHREYRVVDPRAKYAKRLAKALTQDTQHELTYHVLEAIEERFTERMAEKGKDLYANIEFYKGLIYRAIGLPTRFFTTGFAMARVFGYVAHFIESREDNRLIRPAVKYVGPPVSNTAVPKATLASA